MSYHDTKKLLHSRNWTFLDHSIRLRIWNNLITCNFIALDIWFPYLENVVKPLNKSKSVISLLKIEWNEVQNITLTF